MKFSIKRRKVKIDSGLLASSLENAVPEQMFSTPTQQVQGVSAVAALKLAAEQGQRIYHITKENQAQTLPNLRLDGLALQEIQQGLNAGKEVIAHTDRISVPGFIGEGYIVFDPITGGGAYKITGGGNGGYLNLDDSSILSFLVFLKDILVAAIDKILLSVIDMLYSLLSGFYDLSEACPPAQYYAAAAVFGLLLGVGFIVGFLFPFAYGLLFGLIYGYALEGLLRAQIAVCKNN